MTLRPLLPAILLALVMSVVVGVLAVGRASGPTLALAVGLFVLQIGFAAMRVNAPFWQAENAKAESDPAVASTQSNAVLAALIYTWGATALLAIYSMSGLAWRHWWQYGAGMGIVAAAIFVYAFLLGAGSPRVLRTRLALDGLSLLTAAQGIAVSLVLIYLLLTGKLGSPRSDWAASYIFAAGSFMLAILSTVAILTYRKVSRRRG